MDAGHCGVGVVDQAGTYKYYVDTMYVYIYIHMYTKS